MLDISAHIEELNNYINTVIKLPDHAGIRFTIDPLIKPAGWRKLYTTLYCDDPAAMCQQEIEIPMDATQQQLLIAICDAVASLKHEHDSLLKWDKIDEGV